MKRILLGFWTCIIIGLASCIKETDTISELEQLTKEINAIDADLSARGLTAIKDPSGIRILIDKLGTGLPAQDNDIIDVDYIGRRFNDKFVFDQNKANQVLSGYIPGWRIALAKLPVGSEATIIIPSFYAYKTTGSGNDIPPNTTIEFDVVFNKTLMTSSAAQKLASDTLAIDTYLQNKGIDAIKDSTGLRYVITTPGLGDSPSWYDPCTFKYSIKLLTKDTETVVTFDQSPNDDFYSRPVDYIQGLKVGLQKLAIGAKGVFYIPSGLAYGPQGVSDPNSPASVPGNANVIIEVELIDFD